MINFVSIWFLIFIIITLILYFSFPIKYRWIVLLTASIFFYSFSGLESLIFILLATNIAYITARNIENVYSCKNYNRKKAKRYLILGIITTLCMLLYSKIGNSLIIALKNILSLKSLSFREIIPLGISYYTFSIISYMTDVYWKKQKAEHNCLKLLLYVIYFPHILQGPIPRYKKLASQLYEGHSFNYKNLCFGLQRIIWGYFKKLVIADRFALLTSEVFGNSSSYEGLIFIIAAFFASVELYCDFSGCMDIALGFSEILSIHLDENFRQPFYSKSAAEFWHRWHITLGLWFKDYIYMPIVISPILAKISQKTKHIFNSRFAKNIMVIIPLSAVWLLTGLWHGTGANYIIWGCYWGTIIIFSTLFASEYKKLLKKFRINTSSKYYKRFQILRTCLLYIISRLLTVPSSLEETSEIIQKIFKNFNIWVLFDETLYNIGLDRKDFWIGMIAILILWKISSLKEKGIHVREKIASYPIILRWLIYYIGILSIIIFGIYGSEHGGTTFTYMQY